MTDWITEFSFSPDIPKTIGKDWHLHLYGTYEHQVWKADKSRGVDSHETTLIGKTFTRETFCAFKNSRNFKVLSG